MEARDFSRVRLHYSAEDQQRYVDDYDKAREDDIAEYDRYWRPCIIVKVDN